VLALYGLTGKDSWKARNEALTTVLEKATQAAKCGVVYTAGLKDITQALVRRFSDTNQNLRPKAVDALAAIARGVGPDIEKVRVTAPIDVPRRPSTCRVLCSCPAVQVRRQRST
jgi:hypothetical protein